MIICNIIIIMHIVNFNTLSKSIIVAIPFSEARRKAEHGHPRNFHKIVSSNLDFSYKSEMTN